MALYYGCFPLFSWLSYIDNSLIINCSTIDKVYIISISVLHIVIILILVLVIQSKLYILISSFYTFLEYHLHN